MTDRRRHHPLAGMPPEIIEKPHRAMIKSMDIALGSPE